MNTNSSLLLPLEKLALAGSPNVYEGMDGLYVEMDVSCPGNAVEVLNKLVGLLRVANSVGTGSWPADKDWQKILPDWLLEISSPEPTEKELAAELALKMSIPFHQWVAVMNAKPWSISSWVYWFQPDKRGWYWNSAEIRSNNEIKVSVFALEQPFPWEALSWAARAAGAENAEIVD